ncbi:MAG: flagellar basal body L-ring protein FlgH, partial [Alphaproteobacteria bacterium]|nr:flagellar basal body L-ring protein FlgH [Alphaproteobacteria bacterium]
MRNILTLTIMANLLAGCSGINELKTAVAGTNLSGIENIKDSNDDLVKTPQPDPIVEQPNRNSLWQPGARSFFKDQRASRPGDILTVVVNINDSANMNNSTKKERSSQNKNALSKLAGAETGLHKYFPGITPASVFDTSSTPSHSGKGTINRAEQINLEVAAMVVQLLPNGNLVIKGEQEILVNSELRRLHVSGVISKADIDPGNIVNSRRIS